MESNGIDITGTWPCSSAAMRCIVYTPTWFLKRVHDYHSIASDGTSSQNARNFRDDPVTVREYLLFLEEGSGPRSILLPSGV